MNTLAAPRPNPWLDIWSDPRATIRYLLTTDPDHMVLPLAALSGVVQVLGNAFAGASGDAWSMTTIAVFALVIGPIAGIVVLHVQSWLIAWTGEWMGGRGRSDEVQTAVAWANVPMVATLPLWAVAYLLVGSNLFTDPDAASPAVGLLILLFGIVQILFWTYTLVILFQGVAEAQEFSSAWKGFANVLLAFAVGCVGLFLVALLVALLFL